VISIKVFANSFIHKRLELTSVDLLRKVERPNPKLPQREVLSQDEREQVLKSYDLDTFEDVRDRAIVATFAATGLRLEAVRTLPLSSCDRITGEFTAEEKGDVARVGRLSPKAMKYMREYLARRPRNALTDQLWATGRGEPLSNGGLNMVIRRARQRSGIKRMQRTCSVMAWPSTRPTTGRILARSRRCSGTRARRWRVVTRAKR
jgi:site-specific recombinase XerD